VRSPYPEHAISAKGGSYLVASADTQTSLRSDAQDGNYAAFHRGDITAHTTKALCITAGFYITKKGIFPPSCAKGVSIVGLVCPTLSIRDRFTRTTREMRA
jgi:hypothetical protein